MSATVSIDLSITAPTQRQTQPLSGAAHHASNSYTTCADPASALPTSAPGWMYSVAKMEPEDAPVSPKGLGDGSGNTPTSLTAAGRVNQACASCRRKKVRCDGVQPHCGNCISRNISCTYLAQKKRGRPPKSQSQQQQQQQQRTAGPYLAPGASTSSMQAGTGYSGAQPRQTQGSLFLVPSSGRQQQTPPPGYFAQWASHAPDAAGSATSSSLGLFQQQYAYPSDHSLALFSPGDGAMSGAGARLTTSTGEIAGEGAGHRALLVGGLQLTPATDHRQALPSPAGPGRPQMLSHHAAFGLHTGSSAAVVPPSTASALPVSGVGFFSFPPQGNVLLDLFPVHSGSATTEVQGSDYFESYTVAPHDAAPRPGSDGLDSRSIGAPFHGLNYTPSAAAPLNAMGFTATSASTPIAEGAGGSLEYSSIIGQFQPLTVPPPMPPLLLAQKQGVSTLSTVLPQPPHTTDASALSSSLGFVAFALASNSAASAPVQASLDHLSNVTSDIPHASHPLEFTPRAPRQPHAAPIHSSLLQTERRADLAGDAVHSYFCYIHPQCPILHKPSFLRQIADGSVNRFVWLSMRALATRPLLHSHILAASEVLEEEEHFAVSARTALSDELKKPSVDVVQGLALLSLYIFGTPRWQEASMYWCKAVRLAQLMEFHVIDAPSRAIATKMHFGIFEPPKPGTTHQDDLALIPGDFSGDHVPMSQALTPLEAELRRRLWWTLFTNERFCAIAERLPTMVNEARMFVHLPCSARDWDCPEFPYRAPERVPRYQREGYMRVGVGHDMNKLTLGQEIRERKRENLYMMSEIEYGFSMSHLVAFLADMGSLFRPRSPYGNDYTPMFLQMHWAAKMKMLRANVERVERIFEMVRQDILRMLADSPLANPSCWSPGPRLSNGNTADCDPVLDPEAHVSGIEIPHLHHLVMLILYSTLNIHLYRMVFQIHYEFSSSLPEPADRRAEDAELLSAFDQYVKELWERMTIAARQVSRILRGEYPGVPQWVLALAEIKPNASPTSDSTSSAPLSDVNQEASADSTDSSSDSPELQNNMDVERSPSVSKSDGARDQSTHRLRSVFRERIRAQEMRLHEIAHSVLASFHRTLPYALLLVAKVHIDNIKWWTNEEAESEVARTYLDLSVVALFLETHQALFSSTDYVSLVKGIMRSNNIKSSDVGI